jgi:hypothetical protein
MVLHSKSLCADANERAQFLVLDASDWYMRKKQCRRKNRGFSVSCARSHRLRPKAILYAAPKADSHRHHRCGCVIKTSALVKHIRQLYCAQDLAAHPRDSHSGMDYPR